MTSYVYFYNYTANKFPIYHLIGLTYTTDSQTIKFYLLEESNQKNSFHFLGKMAQT